MALVKEDPHKGPWKQGKALPLSGFLQPKKQQCGFCDFYFLPENLPGVTTRRAVLESRAALGIETAKEHLSKWQATRLYATVRLCCFCEQLFRPSTLTEDE